MSRLILMAMAIAGFLAADAQAQSNPLTGRTAVFRNTAAGRLQPYSASNAILSRPTVSPYLRLAANNGTVNTASQYQSIRRELETRRQVNRQGQQLQLLSTQINSLNRSQSNIQSGITGHPTRFMAFSHYYGLQRGQ